MNPDPAAESLEHSHTPQAIAERLSQSNPQDDLGDFVLGAVDGTITTFAIVAGVAGSGLPAGVAIVLGMANVLADGLSMAVGNYLKARSDHELLERRRRMEHRHIDQAPEGEREEIRQIFAAKGFKGETLEQVVAVITADRDRWVNTMLTEELGMQISPPSPARAAVVTFLAFVLAGLAPIAPLGFSAWLGAKTTFLASTVLTFITFAAIGAVRGKVTEQGMLRGVLETVLVGGAASALAYLVGVTLRSMVAS